MTLRATLLWLLLFCFPVAGHGANEHQNLKQLNHKISQKKVLLKATQKIEKKVSAELTLIEKGLRTKEVELRRLNGELNALEQSLARTRRQTEHTQLEVDRKQQEIRTRLVALYKAGDTGPVRVFFSPGTFPQMLESLRYMQAILVADRKMIDDYDARIRSLTQLKAQLEEDARKMAALRTVIEAKKREIEVEKKRKADYLVKVRQDKESYSESLKQLEANAASLQAMIQKLDAKSRKSYSKPIAPQPAPQAKETPAKQNRSADTTHSGFGGRKRQLALPVRGEVVQRFGRHKHPEFNSYTVSNGLTLAASSGAEIHAVDGGTVIYANYFKGYGNMVILDHGDGYFSLYAHASSTNRKEGSVVARNDVIATLGDGDSGHGPQLYFEIRHQGKPVDPSPWFK